MIITIYIGGIKNETTLDKWDLPILIKNCGTA